MYFNRQLEVKEIASGVCHTCLNQTIFSATSAIHQLVHLITMLMNQLLEGSIIYDFTAIYMCTQYS